MRSTPLVSHPARPARRGRSTRVLGVLCAAAAIAGFGISSSASAAPDRPTISGFYVRDEGSLIRLKVNWCVPSYALNTSVISTFRVWDPTGRMVVNRRVSGRATSMCMNDQLRLGDSYANGLYSANVSVTNRTLGGFIRLQARDFWVS